MSTAVAPPPTSRSLLRSGVSVTQYHVMHLMGALFPITAGVLLFGWRALAVLGMVVGAAALATLVWRRIGARGMQLDWSHTLWLALLLGLMLPPHLATGGGAGIALWPLAVGAGVLVVVLAWAVGGVGMLRVHPVAAAYLLVAVLYADPMTPHWVLQRQKLAAGDVLNGPWPPRPYSGVEPWLNRPRVGNLDAFWAEPVTQPLIAYTTGAARAERGRIPLHELLRDRMPPLEDLVVGGHPAPIGTGSAIAVIIGGLFLMYRGLIDFRVPLGVIVFAYIAMLVLPVPTVIREDGPVFRWLAMRQPDVRWESAITFVNYEVMASPLLFTAFFLATSPGIRPMTRRARVVFAALLGVACAASQLYLSAAWGPYAALLAVGLLGPSLDRMFRPRTLV